MFVDEFDRVQVTLENNGIKQTVGTVELATVVSPARLKVLDERFFFETEFSGLTILYRTGIAGPGSFVAQEIIQL